MVPVDQAFAWTGMTLALGATALTWVCTAAGAALVFILPPLTPRVFSALLAVAGGVMLAAGTGLGGFRRHESRSCLAHRHRSRGRRVVGVDQSAPGERRGTRLVAASACG